MNNNEDARVKERVVAWTRSHKALSSKINNRKIINMKTIQIAIMAAALVMAVQAQAAMSTFDLQYSDPSGNVLSGLLTANPLGGNEYLAVSGSITLTSSSNPGLNGTYTLLAGGPGTLTSPSGQFLYNNVLYYPGDPIVDFSGVLAFTSSPGVELNLFGTAPGNYALYSYNGSQVNLYPGGGFNNQGGVATASLTPVPEPTTMLAGAGALGLALLGIGRARRSSVVRIGK
jgi:hypothetical protein